MHIKSRCIMCSDVDFLYKCLNLLYLIKELILCDSTTQLSYVCHKPSYFFFPLMSNETHCFFPSLHDVYCSTIAIKSGGMAAAHRSGMHKVHSLLGSAAIGSLEKIQDHSERLSRGQQAGQICWHLLSPPLVTAVFTQVRNLWYCYPSLLNSSGTAHS